LNWIVIQNIHTNPIEKRLLKKWRKMKIEFLHPVTYFTSIDHYPHNKYLFNDIWVTNLNQVITSQHKSAFCFQWKQMKEKKRSSFNRDELFTWNMYIDAYEIMIFDSDHKGRYIVEGFFHFTWKTWLSFNIFIIILLLLYDFEYHFDPPKVNIFHH
jgi:hypothetical protein